MSIKLAVACAVAFAMGILLLPANAFAQTGSIFKVSNAIEGSNNPQGMSVARCGPGIVVGFGDQEPGAPSSNAGLAISKNAAVFTDLGTLAAPSLRYGGSDTPVIACSNPTTFYYGTLGFNGDASVGCAVTCSEVAVSLSKDGGSTWNAPVVASWVANDIYEINTPSLGLDPSNAKRLYSAYINHNSVGPNDFPGCSNGDEYLLEIVRSTDGGKTWNGRTNPAQSGPSANIPQPDYACTSPGFAPQHSGELAWPTVIVSPAGKVYVAYLFIGNNSPNEIRITTSVDGGATFSTPMTVSQTAINGAQPVLGVDRTSSGNRGEVYVAWSGSRTGNSTDVLVSESLNSGASFSFARPINPAPVTGAGHFQINPVLAVDNDGQVAVCFYETPGNLPASNSVYSYNCALSFNHAATWQVRSVKTGVPVGYGAVTSDFLLHNDGFFTTFEVQANGTRSVVGQKFEMN
jgi:hypothetical protein